MEKHDQIVIIGAGVFGLTTAYQLATEGYGNILVVDRHMPPVPDGSSSDLSKAVRFDYADEMYLNLAHEAYTRWSTEPKYKGIFHPCHYIACGTRKEDGSTWIDKTTAALSQKGLPWIKLDNAAAAKQRYPLLTGDLASPPFYGYNNLQSGWAEANKAVTQLREDCLELGVSFICGPRGTIVELNVDAQNKIKSAKTVSGHDIEGDHFVLAAGAWSSNLVPTYNSTLATAQVMGFVRLSDVEMEKYKSLPIYINLSTGWFNFPPHKDTNLLKILIHGWGYTRLPATEDKGANTANNPSMPPMKVPRQRPDYVPADGEARLREGLREMLPELADRPFERAAMCWYTDTPTGDFIMDYHPDYPNLFLGGGGSGHGFKFLPVLGKYMSLAMRKGLPATLAQRWRFRNDYAHRQDVFAGDGSRGGPERRELTSKEKDRLVV